MNRIQAETAIHDKTFNNLKASRASLNELYSQNITRIVGSEQLEVFTTLVELKRQIAVLTEQNTALNTKVTQLETRVNDIVVE